MARRKQQNPDEVVHIQVAKGETVLYEGLAYCDRGTLQVRRRHLDRVEGKFEEVDPAKLPDVADL